MHTKCSTDGTISGCGRVRPRGNMKISRLALEGLWVARDAIGEVAQEKEQVSKNGHLHGGLGWSWSWRGLGLGIGQGRRWRG
jgi:hypothetical protein